MIKSTIILCILTFSLTGCSIFKQGLKTAGSVAGGAYASEKGENVILGTLVGGLIGTLAGQAISQSSGL